MPCRGRGRRARAPDTPRLRAVGRSGVGLDARGNLRLIHEDAGRRWTVPELAATVHVCASRARTWASIWASIRAKLRLTESSRSPQNAGYPPPANRRRRVVVQVVAGS